MGDHDEQVSWLAA